MASLQTAVSGGQTRADRATHNEHSRLSRRLFLKRFGATGFGLASFARLELAPSWLRAAEAPANESEPIRRITDPEIRAGVEAAVFKNLLPAATERVYPGHFTINANGGGYGSDSTWPGLDSWQMIGPYLHLGRTRLVLDYFDFVRASQRKDGNIPFAIFNGNTRPGGCLRGLKYPDDLFTYAPPKHDGLPAASQETRQWIGLFEHWQTKGFPLSTLAPVCYVLTAAEIFDATGSRPWVKERLGSVESAAKFLLTLRKDSGLIGGSGFYIEAPPREGCDGVTQCYAVHAFRQLARLFRAAGETTQGAVWSAHADKLAKTFVEVFWRDDHFGEYVHPQHGLVDVHGLSDVNWAAIAFSLADSRKLERLWPRLVGEPVFWAGDMPTQIVTKPFTYESWEFNRSPDCPADPLNDVAAMGRVWYLEALACQRMKARARLVDSVRKVCRAAKGAIGASGITSSPMAACRPTAHRSTASTRRSWRGWCSAIEKSSLHEGSIERCFASPSGGSGLTSSGCKDRLRHVSLRDRCICGLLLLAVLPAFAREYRFDGSISEPVLRSYLSRSMTTLDLVTGHGNLDDNIRMLKDCGVKFAGRTIYLWGQEADLPRKLELAKKNAAKVHDADPEIILQACVFEIVSQDVGNLPVPDWAFAALGQPVEKRNFRYEAMLYASRKDRDQWSQGASVPDVSLNETKLWFYYLAASYIDAGCEAIHFGQAEIMNHNDRGLDHWAQMLGLVRNYAAKHARRHLVLCDAHVPSGGLVRQGKLLLDFHSFPLRIAEVAQRPQEGELRIGFIDSMYSRSKGGITPSGWRCGHLPYLVELDNWGVSSKPSQAGTGGCWVWGYDEITWFAQQPEAYRNEWLRYAWRWVREHDHEGYLEMPGSRCLAVATKGKQWYCANRASAATPDGFGQEETIRAIWAGDATSTTPGQRTSNLR